MGHAAPRPRRSAALLFLVYLLVCLGPLALAFTDLMPGRGLVVNFSIALGFVALAVLGMQFVLTARTTRLLSPFSIDAVLRYHRQITLLAVGAAFGHPLLLFVYSNQYRALWNILRDPLRAQLAWLSIIALGMLVITSVWRKALRLDYRAWHVVHSMLGIVTVLAALAHAFLVNYYLSEPWERLAWGAYGAAFLWLALWVRVIRPLRNGLQPWRVANLWPEPGGALTVSLEPAFRRDRPFTFQAGQFAWIQPKGRPMSFDYHPFTMSSSTQRSQVDFTMAPVGDWTDSMRQIHVGDRMYVDGPHGSFTLERHPGIGYVFIATGVGVTPFLSMLSTLADRDETRPPPCWLFLGNRYENQITGIRQIAHLAARMPQLTLVNVISRPTEEWDGECGHIDAELLRYYLPAHYRHLQFFVCGRPEIVQNLRSELRSELRVSARRIHAEDFDLV